MRCFLAFFVVAACTPTSLPAFGDAMDDPNPPDADDAMHYDVWTPEGYWERDTQNSTGTERVRMDVWEGDAPEVWSVTDGVFTDLPYSCEFEATMQMESAQIEDDGAWGLIVYAMNMVTQSCREQNPDFDATDFDTGPAWLPIDEKLLDPKLTCVMEASTYSPVSRMKCSSPSLSTDFALIRRL